MSLNFFSALLLVIFSMLPFLLQNKMVTCHDGHLSLHEYCLSQYQLMVILPTSGQVLSPLRRPFPIQPCLSSPTPVGGPAISHARELSQ